ncbi:hypothetical protein TV39_19545 [Arthrobacter sp. SPG23]|uniref:hypothetical protein n=1 Tax=Arthrobacter sp. SPG23 TaxID=1610703 RepID=UPI0005C304A2|nr:hypothetical protein [Arthrobacter sp. SPG23]KIS25696.1 hypothetical protein TV39_19545 [Arthrobacter sp. SPG23]
MSLLAALLTRADTGRGSLDWVAPTVLWSLPVLFGLVSVFLGIGAVRGAPRGSNSRTAAVSALWISGLLVFVALTLVIRKGDFMILF